MVSISRNSTFNSAFDSICTREYPRTGKTMGFAPEVGYEVIREVVSYKLYRPLVNPSNKVWRDLTQTKNPTSPFYIGDSLR